MSVFDIVNRIKEWFYAIPVVAWFRHQYYKVRDWNRAAGYAVNWFIAHPLGAYSLTGVGAFVGLVFFPAHVWALAFSASLLVWFFYFVKELGDWCLGSAPWYDHVGDMIGPTWVLYHMWSLRP